MKDNEIALRSQQLSEQTGAREADALARQSAVFQRLPDTVTGFQQASMAAQRQHEEMLHSASDLANDELKRKQAQEDLQWAQQLHTTTAMEYQTRGLKAQTEFEEARLAKAKRDLNNDISYGEFGELNDERKDNIIAGTGKKFIPGHGGVTIVDASQEEREAARGRLKLSRQEKMMSVALNAAYAGYVPDMEKGEFKYDPEAAKETTDRYQQSRSRFGGLGDLGDEGDLSLRPQNGAPLQPPAPGQPPTPEQATDKVLSGFSVPLPAGMDANAAQSGVLKDAFQTVPFSALSPKRQAFVREQLAKWIAPWLAEHANDPNRDAKLKSVMYNEFAKSRTAQQLFDERPFHDNAYPSGR